MAISCMQPMIWKLLWCAHTLYMQQDHSLLSPTAFWNFAHPQSCSCACILQRCLLAVSVASVCPVTQSKT